MDLTGSYGFLALVIVVATIGIAMRVKLVRRRGERLLREYRDAFDRGDADEAERVRDALERMFTPTAANRLIGEAELLILRERWAEARDVLARVKREHLPMINRPGVLNNLAYATAHAGDPDKGIELARNALAEAEKQGEKYPASKVVNIRGTIGIALSLAGRHKEAIEALEPLKNESGAPRSRAARAYFLGESLRATGKADRARTAYETAAGFVGKWAERARARIE